ncbi:MAG: efflux RND transporter periplasmic adaptor subunit [Gemmatimonadetes bacterium]|uniref:Efflux RND transporter periplasmic adaptor subunit n=1 Tax=Candidatus Kutchimonas denitrificans TaxID=3056748 RepID=A0AAE4Z7F9_9BACT|nr:efflux RND transporter periplasmic adaptor subunit [Gemmatimonadota bacterium]NIR74097.1 efflux RND transporter periplasmic adaptor subunit [Candidatus Kutchimonas denitrificans]NIS01659.1 efflux RND transporter periplasmic adaptor subunit [Gemmatimonadota bacterium]NIT67397.1 efflux RND transporter periplasmic adaptor subunit [Gemmatimonadota bacterium]NIU52760.1 efflux RND transporter periplasmic adaptor subunit [Gemmatimonadota bacterium]
MRTLSIVLLILVAGSGALFVTRGGEGNGDGGNGSGARTEPAARRDLRATVLATGVVRPMVGAEVRVGSRVSGVLERLYVTVGDRVREGQLLAQLDSSELATRVRQAEAALENARAEHAYATQEYTRAVELARRELISETDMAAIERGRDVTAAQVGRAEADLEAARIQLGYTRIYAPIGGVVAEVATQVGETVAASFASPTFVTIIDLDRLEVWAYVDETDIGRVEVGQRVLFTVDTYADTEFEGEVTAIRPQAEIQDALVNYVTVIEIIDGHGKILRPEMTATVNILLESRENVIAIPNRAVRRDRDGTYVFVAEASARVRKDIRVGYRGREYTEVVQGLAEGDRVIVGTISQ